MTCPKCQHTVPEGAKFCPNCGTALSQHVPCPHCGTENDISHTYCIACGGMLKIPEPGGRQGNVPLWRNPYLVIMLAGILAMGVATYYNLDKGPVGGAVVSATPPPPPSQAEAQAAMADATEGELPFTPEELETHIQALKDKIAQEPENVQHYVDLGNLLFDATRFSEAIPYYQKALELNPNQPDVVVDLGVCYFQLENYDKAKELFQKALDIAPNHVTALYNMGIVDIRMGNVEGLIEAWTKLIEVAPTSPQAIRAKQILDEAHQQVEQDNQQNQQTGGAD